LFLVFNVIFRFIFVNSFIIFLFAIRVHLKVIFMDGLIPEVGTMH
jgi:hypothetical protein